MVIGPEQRLTYVEGLQALQVGGDPEPYRRFMEGRLAASLDHHLDVLRRGLDQGPAPSPAPDR